MRLNKKLLALTLAAISALSITTAHATTTGLTAVTVNGDKMVNDTVLNVTWADIVPTCTNPNSDCVTYYPGPGSVYSSSNWYGVTYEGSAQEWIAGLNTANYGGHNDWRLATGRYFTTPNSTNCASGTDNELGCLFANELGGFWVYDFQPFTKLKTYVVYWSSSVYYNGKDAYFTDHSAQASTNMNRASSAIAVRTGLTEVAPVPLPASAWLLLSGLAGIGLLSKRKQIR